MLTTTDEFGPRLARIRRERGITQVELAEAIGSIQVVISNYERGKARPYADTVARIAEALGVTTDELLGRTPLPESGLQRSRRFLRRLKLVEELPRRDQDALLRTIDAFLSARGAT
jgi:transcriptional regulator with XRE-family HTH domain